jgi:ribonuclease HI
MHFEIYTDGSWDIKSKSGGWAYSITAAKHKTIDSGFSPNTTNNSMELYAIYKALDRVLTDILPKGYTCERVTIYSDSEFCVRGINNHCLDNFDQPITKIKHAAKFEAIRSIIKELNCRIVVKHVKGHANNNENNEVDRLAVTARVWGVKDMKRERAFLGSRVGFDSSTVDNRLHKIESKQDETIDLLMELLNQTSIIKKDAE